ncbi:hypothetical protein RRG08_027966 [Elysia crispata]|uniref:Uncharacterized protein n=1 Tax=Elysia crispata TaxID=231223 RepID=A0AAE0ZJ93_9GAST|nr:hypothetical protein RRG08_027966 [Elysia crispata]
MFLKLFIILNQFKIFCKPFLSSTPSVILINGRALSVTRDTWPRPCVTPFEDITTSNKGDNHFSVSPVTPSVSNYCCPTTTTASNITICSNIVKVIRAVVLTSA